MAAMLLVLHLVLAALMVGRNPPLFRGVTFLADRATRGDQPGMRLAVYRQVQPSGKGWRHSIPAASALLDVPNASLEAFAVWQVPRTGTYVLVFRCDEDGAVYVDGHRVIGLHGRSINGIGRSAVPLEQGPHLLVVYLRSGVSSGWFNLDVIVPGTDSAMPLPAETLRPLKQRYFPYFWRVMIEGTAWVRGPTFWFLLIALTLATAASWHARTLKQAALNGALLAAGVVGGALVGELASRFVLPAPTRVTFKITSSTSSAGSGQNVFMIPTERGLRHTPNSEVIVVHPAARDTPTLYRTNSLGYRNREIGPKQGERILFLGDSITLGLAVNEPFTFVRLVEGMARRDGRSWETINAGVNGLGTNGELAVLNETGLSVSPDVVVLGFYLNDFLESPGIYLDTLPGLLDRSVLAHQLVSLTSRYTYLTASEREALD